MIELNIKHGHTGEPASAHEQLADADGELEVVFESTQSWRTERPRSLVVACSDGRLQESIDEFLDKRLGIIDYDRLYAPGGAGVLAVGSGEVRMDQLRRELKFLMEAHRIEETVLLFHGASKSGPEHATCAHYKRILPGASRLQVSRQQHADASDAMHLIGEIAPRVKIHVFRAEVRHDNSVHFVNLLRQ